MLIQTSVRVCVHFISALRVSPGGGARGAFSCAEFLSIVYRVLVVVQEPGRACGAVSILVSVYCLLGSMRRLVYCLFLSGRRPGRACVYVRVCVSAVLSGLRYHILSRLSSPQRLCVAFFGWWLCVFMSAGCFVALTGQGSLKAPPCPCRPLRYAPRPAPDQAVSSLVPPCR